MFCQIFGAFVTSFGFVFVCESSSCNLAWSLTIRSDLVFSWLSLSYNHPSIHSFLSQCLIFLDILPAQPLSQWYVGQPGISVWWVLPVFQPLQGQRPSTHSSGYCHRAQDSQARGWSHDENSTHPRRELQEGRGGEKQRLKQHFVWQ